MTDDKNYDWNREDNLEPSFGLVVFVVLAVIFWLPMMTFKSWVVRLFKRR